MVKGGISYLEFELHNDDYLMATSGIGRQKDWERHEIKLSTTWKPYYKVDILHEIMHVLGFRHEFAILD